MLRRLITLKLICFCLLVTVVFHANALDYSYTFVSPVGQKTFSFVLSDDSAVTLNSTLSNGADCGNSGFGILASDASTVVVRTGTAPCSSTQASGPFPLKAGTYYLLLYHNGYGGTYSARLTPTASSRANDAEPNDSAATALTIPANAGRVTGHMGYYNAVSTDGGDFYRLTLTQDGSLGVTLTTDTTLSSSGYILLSSDGSTQVRDLSLLTAGTYYLQLYADTYYAQAYGGYTLETAFTPKAISLDLIRGWNLFGNSAQVPITVASTFNDSTKTASVWKWVIAGTTTGVVYPNWAFYSAGLSDGGQAYARSKGYEYLTTINAGEGFWLNANTAFTAQLPAGAAVTSTAFQNMASGWHLIAIGETKTPSGFNAALSTTPPAAGVVPQNMTTLWLWDNAQAKWYFYAPSLEAQGGTALSDYITAHNYLDFTSGNKTLGSGVGFWVNKQ
jgi:hypothetical protein